MKSFLRPAGLLCLCVSGIIFAQDGPESVIRGTKQFQKRVIVSGLAEPWELTWGPDNMLWVTERTGKRVTRVDPANGARTVAITIDEATSAGGPDGVLGMALHPELLKGTGNDFVYVAYTYVDKIKGPDLSVTDPESPYRYLYFKIVRLRYNPADRKLSDPLLVVSGLPAGDDHSGGRLKFGPDGKLYFTIGDQGHNQFANFCLPVEAQRLPTRQEIDAKDYSAYVGKSLRLNLDGSIPRDNPKLNGVVSHVFTYGHRNPQGLDFGPDGTLYSAEHGPKTDDEINILTSGSNYGWPHVAGFKDDKAYVYARWADSKTPCAQLKYNDLDIPASVPQDRESAFTQPFVNPIATMFTVPTGHNFQDRACGGVDYICWPTVGISDVEYYESKGKGVPGWDKVLLISTLKRGSLYVLPLSADGKKAAGHFSRYFESENRFRDTAVNPDGRTIYIATDPSGLAGAADAGTTSKMDNPGAILAFTYIGEGASNAEPAQSTANAKKSKPEANPAPIVVGGIAPQFTTAQAARGKTAYTATCVACHGTTMTNGAYGTPLAGEYFNTRWSRRSVRALYERAQKTMPPGAPGSLPPDTYADIVAYILEVNGFTAGDQALRVGDEKLGRMVLK
ncbi:MAG: glucose/sorbosone family PQQ-dependent dehydrogenase [Bryobacteraceae bacterium]